jgi:hypothetical protein
MLFKQECRLPIDTSLCKEEVPETAQSCFEEIIKNAEITKEIASENMKRQQEKYKKQHDEKVRPPNYKIGQKVWLLNNHKKPGITPKLQKKYIGPYYITKDVGLGVFILRDAVTNKMVKSPVNAARLRPYWSPEDRPTNPVEEEVVEDDTPADQLTGDAEAEVEGTSKEREVTKTDT